MRGATIRAGALLSATVLVACDAILGDLHGVTPDGGDAARLDAQQTADTSSRGDADHSGDATRPFDGTHPLEAGHREAGTDATAAPPDASADSPSPTPPEAGADARVTLSTQRHTFAVHDIFLGDTGFNGQASTTAWESFGYDIDGLVTTAASTDVCGLAVDAGATSTIQVDGPGGIDNSFGKNFFEPIASQVDPSSTYSAGIHDGQFTLLLVVDGLDSTNPNMTATGLSADLFAGAPYGGTPPGTDAGFAADASWPLNPSSLGDPPSVATATVQFFHSYVTTGTWVSGPRITYSILIELHGFAVPLTISAGLITFDYVVDENGQGHARHGILSGVMPVSALVSAFGSALSAQKACGLVPLTAGDVAKAQDILEDGTNTPGVPCDAVSIGIGFEGDEIALPSTVGSEAPAAPPCDGGAGDGDAGAFCDADTQCQSDAKDGGALMCNTVTGKCISSACANPNDVCGANRSDECCPNANDAGSSCVPGDCCGASQCSTTTQVCNDHTCTECAGDPAPDGCLCVFPDDCASGVCGTGSTCLPPACAPACAAGSPCGANTDCASTRCVAAECQ